MCGIVGIYHKKEPACGDVYDALIQVQHRGQDAAGISTWDTEKILTHKYTGLVTEVFKHQKTFDKLVGNIGIGHVRYPTAGGDNVSEAQPFFTANPVNISLAHNGTLTNSEKLKEELIRINFCQFNTNGTKINLDPTSTSASSLVRETDFKGSNETSPIIESIKKHVGEANWRQTYSFLYFRNPY